MADLFPHSQHDPLRAASRITGRYGTLVVPIARNQVRPLVTLTVMVGLMNLFSATDLELAPSKMLLLRVLTLLLIGWSVGLIVAHRMGRLRMVFDDHGITSYPALSPPRHLPWERVAKTRVFGFRDYTCLVVTAVPGHRVRRLWLVSYFLPDSLSPAHLQQRAQEYMAAHPQRTRATIIL